jgi:hypothetical protein
MKFFKTVFVSMLEGLIAKQHLKQGKANMHQNHQKIEGNLPKAVLSLISWAVGKAGLGIAAALDASVYNSTNLLLTLKANTITHRGCPKIPISSLTTA